MGEWTKYRMNLAQLRQYLQIRTGHDDVTVVASQEPASTHLPTKIVTLDPDDPMAAVSATHEGLHITETETMEGPGHTFRRYLSQPERIVLNVLEDGRIERLGIRQDPGLRVQFQEDIDTLWPLILREEWTAQALKGMYMLVGGYRFDEHALKPRARRVLGKFRPFVVQARRAKTTSDLIPLLKPIIALFDEELPRQARPQPTPPEPEEAQLEGVGERGDGEDDDFGVPTGRGDDGDDERDVDDDATGKSSVQSSGQSSGQAEQGKSGDDASDDGEDNDECDGECPACKSQKDGQRESDSDADGYAERDAVEYDADEVSAELEAAEKMGEGPGDDDERRHGGRPVRVRGRDKVTGGPTVNQLVQRAKAIRRKIDRIEQGQAEERRRRAEAEAEEYVSTDAPTAPSPASAGSPRKLPESMRELADLKQAWEQAQKTWQDGAVVKIDYAALKADRSVGGLGYRGQGLFQVRNWRKMTRNQAAARVEAIEAAYRPTCNYLSRVLRTLMQTADRRGLRDHERTGLLDRRRAYQLGAAKLDVFRQAPNPRDGRPIVLLTTDCSGSMEGGGAMRHDTKAFHAMAATLVLAGSLHRLGIPFETHAFDVAVYVTKMFEDRYDSSVVRAMANTWAHAGGSTYAAEALAVAWGRIMYHSEPRKVIIMVTDGQVAQNTAELVKAIERQGTLVIGVGVGVDVHSTFPHAITIENAADLPNRFAILMKQFLPADGKWRRAA